MAAPGPLFGVCLLFVRGQQFAFTVVLAKNLICVSADGVVCMVMLALLTADTLVFAMILASLNAGVVVFSTVPAFLTADSLVLYNESVVLECRCLCFVITLQFSNSDTIVFSMILAS